MMILVIIEDDNCKKQVDELSFKKLKRGGDVFLKWQEDVPCFQIFNLKTYIGNFCSLESYFLEENKERRRKRGFLELDFL